MQNHQRDFNFFSRERTKNARNFSFFSMNAYRESKGFAEQDNWPKKKSMQPERRRI
jgi:hypothetical protein